MERIPKHMQEDQPGRHIDCDVVQPFGATKSTSFVVAAALGMVLWWTRFRLGQDPRGRIRHRAARPSHTAVRYPLCMGKGLLRLVLTSPEEQE